MNPELQQADSKAGTSTFRHLTLGAADEQIGQCEGAGENSYRSSAVRVLVRLAADPWALGHTRYPMASLRGSFVVRGHMIHPTTPDRFLAEALRRDIQRHEAHQLSGLGSEYDHVENETLPFRHSASTTFHFAFAFWDSWIDAANHNWQYYPEINQDDWPKFAREFIRCLESGTVINDPFLLDRFGPRPGLKRLVNMFTRKSPRQR